MRTINRPDKGGACAAREGATMASQARSTHAAGCHDGDPFCACGRGSWHHLGDKGCAHWAPTPSRQCTYRTPSGPNSYYGAPMPCVRDMGHDGPHACAIAQGPWWNGTRCSAPETEHAYGSHGACYTEHGTPTPSRVDGPTLPRWYIVQYPNRPTFYLDGWLLGIVSADHAARIAADVLGIDTADPSRRNAPAVVAYAAEDVGR